MNLSKKLLIVFLIFLAIAPFAFARPIGGVFGYQGKSTFWGGQYYEKYATIIDMFIVGIIFAIGTTWGFNKGDRQSKGLAFVMGIVGAFGWGFFAYKSKVTLIGEYGVIIAIIAVVMILVMIAKMLNAVLGGDGKHTGVIFSGAWIIIWLAIDNMARGYIINRTFFGTTFMVIRPWGYFSMCLAIIYFGYYIFTIVSGKLPDARTSLSNFTGARNLDVDSRKIQEEDNIERQRYNEIERDILRQERNLNRERKDTKRIIRDTNMEKRSLEDMAYLERELQRHITKLNGIIREAENIEKELAKPTTVSNIPYYDGLKRRLQLLKENAKPIIDIINNKLEEIKKISRRLKEESVDIEKRLADELSREKTDVKKEIVDDAALKKAAVRSEAAKKAAETRKQRDKARIEQEKKQLMARLASALNRRVTSKTEEEQKKKEIQALKEEEERLAAFERVRIHSMEKNEQEMQRLSRLMAKRRIMVEKEEQEKKWILPRLKRISQLNLELEEIDKKIQVMKPGTNWDSFRNYVGEEILKLLPAMLARYHEIIVEISRLENEIRVIQNGEARIQTAPGKLF